MTAPVTMTMMTMMTVMMTTTTTTTVPSFGRTATATAKRRLRESDHLWWNPILKMRMKMKMKICRSCVLWQR
jgi:hypothetical protein